MTIKPETKIVNKIQEWVNANGGNVLKLYGNSVQRAGEPDLIGGIWIQRAPGNFWPIAFAIEVKQPGEDARELQKYRLKKWNSVGYLTGVAHSLEEFKQIIGWKDNETVGTSDSDKTIHARS